MSVLFTRDGVYRPSGPGAFYDDDSFRTDKPEDKAEDRYVEYGIEPER
jgi:hypothetical protein